MFLFGWLKGGVIIFVAVIFFIMKRKFTNKKTKKNLLDVYNHAAGQPEHLQTFEGHRYPHKWC